MAHGLLPYGMTCPMAYSMAIAMWPMAFGLWPSVWYVACGIWPLAFSMVCGIWSLALGPCRLQYGLCPSLVAVSVFKKKDKAAG